MDFDKSQILDDIKKYLKITTDADFADFLGIKRSRLANWKSRNTYDPELLYTKCNFLNAEILLTGKGDLVKAKNTENVTLSKSDKKSDKKNEKQKIQKMSLINGSTEDVLISLLSEKVFKNIYEKLKELEAIDHEERIDKLEDVVGKLVLLSDEYSIDHSIEHSDEKSIKNEP